MTEYCVPVTGDSTGNDMKWDSMRLEARLYQRSGNYALLRDVRYRQARFCELEGKDRCALAYYCMVFYSDLNGFSSADRVDLARRDPEWRSSARVDAGLVNRIFRLCSRAGISDHELLETFCVKSFVPAAYRCHLFSIRECCEILMEARDGKAGGISGRIRGAESRFKAYFSGSEQNIAF